MQLIKRLALYLLGIALMAFGITLLNRSNLGTTPLSSIPYILSKLFAGNAILTFGTLTLMFHMLCILLQGILCRKCTLKMVLQFPLSVAFAALLDVFMGWLQLSGAALWLRGLLCALGILFSALGIVTVVHTDLMLPAPDALLRVASAQSGIELYRVKIAGDITWVSVTIVISIFFLLHQGMQGLGGILAACFNGTLAVGIGTLFSMYFTGRFVGVFKKHLHLPEMAPLKWQ